MRIHDWHDEEKVYHELKIRREGTILLIGEYTTGDPTATDGTTSLQEERDPSLSELQLAAAHLFKLDHRNPRGTLDGVTGHRISVGGGQYLLGYSFTHRNGQELSEEQLYELLVRHLVDEAVAVEV